MEGEKCSDIKTQKSRVRMLGANSLKVVTFHRLSELNLTEKAGSEQGFVGDELVSQTDIQVKIILR